MITGRCAVAQQSPAVLDRLGRPWAARSPAAQPPVGPARGTSVSGASSALVREIAVRDATLAPSKRVLADASVISSTGVGVALDGPSSTGGDGAEGARRVDLLEGAAPEQTCVSPAGQREHRRAGRPSRPQEPGEWFVAPGPAIVSTPRAPVSLP